MTSETLGFNIATITSNEIRSDRQISDLIQTDAEPGGDINFELSYGTYDAFLAAVLMASAWSTTVAVAASDISAASSDNSFNTVGEDFTAENISVGQWLKVAGFTTAANNGFFKVVSVAEGKLVVSGGTLVDEIAGDAITMSGSMIRNGSTKTSFVLEKKFADIGKYLAFTGMLPATLALNLAASEILTGTIGFQGKTANAMGDASVGTGAANAATTTDVMNAVTNVATIRENGAALSGTYARSLAISLDNNLRGKKAISALGNVGISAGQCNVTGSLEVYFEDETMYNKYLNNTASSIDFRVVDAAGNAYIVTLPKVKFSSGDPQTPGNNEDVMLPQNYQALLDATTACTIQIDRFAA
jgi:hypothetical protein